MTIGTLLRSIFGNERPEDADRCDICDIYVGRGGRWDGVALTCGTSECDDLADAQRSL